VHDIVSHIIPAVVAAVMHSIHRALRESCQTTVSLSPAANDVYTQTDSTGAAAMRPLATSTVNVAHTRLPSVGFRS